MRLRRHLGRLGVGATRDLHGHVAALDEVRLDHQHLQRLVLLRRHRQRQVGRLEVAQHGLQVEPVDRVDAHLVHPQAILIDLAVLRDAHIVVLRDADIVRLGHADVLRPDRRHNARHDRFGEHSRRHRRAAAAVGQLAVVPRVLADIVDDGVRRLDRVTARVAPPDLAVARHLHRKHLLALRLVQSVEEVVQVEVVLDLAHDAVEHQEAIGAHPVEDAVILNDRVRAEDGALRADRVELEHGAAADERRAHQRVGRPEQARR